MKIGKLAELSGVPASRIRFYEKHGLIPSPVRQDNGYRDYPDTAATRLRTIAISKALGFSLSEIRGFLPEDPADVIARTEVIARLEEKLESIDRNIAELKQKRGHVIQTLAYMRDPNSDGC